MTNEEKDKKEYELGILLRSEEDLAGVLSLLAQHGAEVTSEARSKRLALAYEIKKQKEATFASVIFKAYGDEAKNLERDLHLRAEVLRFLVMKTPKASSRPVTAMPASGERPMRPARPASSEPSSARPAAPRPLSNEALEKKIEEILG